MPTTYEHYRPPADFEGNPGVYRVVGCKGDREVTLLRVTNARGRRRATGEVVSVPITELVTFDAVQTPSDGVVYTLSNQASGLFWAVRQLLRG
ncbi:hypothetical protein [Haloarchaeobius sp. DFWS5]|uniref:hypothetical protein n=1 Tax=Haloarchaeobius sp. DFWS5 TaxID=3446114 RepID=UPI003EBDE99E